MGGYLIVNDLMYCADHELEVCGKCGVDHRSGNFLHECAEENAVDLMEEWLVNMKGTGAPPRQAPKKRGKVDFPGNPAVFRPSISDHLLLLDGDANVDPSSFNSWPSGNTEAAMRSHTGLGVGSVECGVPEFAKLPIRRVRETLVVLARRWDDFLSRKTNNEPMCRMLLQDDAQTQVLLLDLLPPIRLMVVGSAHVPVFVVRWAHTKASDMQSAFQVMSTMERNTKMGEISVEVDEIQFLAEILEENAKRIDPSFIRREGRQFLNVSALTSISFEMQNAHLKALVNTVTNVELRDAIQ